MVVENLHIHTKYSWDANIEIGDIVKILKNNEIKYIGFTDHIEFDKEAMDNVLYALSLRNKEIDKIQSKYPSVKLLKSVEISSPHLYKKEVEELKSKIELDYIMGSIHKIDKTAKTSLQRRQAAYAYYREILEMVKADQIDVVGHLDYINRYYDTDYSDQAQLNEIFHEIKKNNMVLEVNASARRRIGDRQPFFPSPDKLKLYKKHRNEIIIGTDAHKLDELLENLPRTDYLTKQLGLEQVIFDKRKMIKL